MIRKVFLGNEINRLIDDQIAIFPRRVLALAVLRSYLFLSPPLLRTLLRSIPTALEQNSVERPSYLLSQAELEPRDQFRTHLQDRSN